MRKGKGSWNFAEYCEMHQVSVGDFERWSFDYRQRVVTAVIQHAVGFYKMVEAFIKSYVSGRFWAPITFYTGERLCCDTVQGGRKLSLRSDYFYVLRLAPNKRSRYSTVSVVKEYTGSWQGSPKSYAFVHLTKVGHSEQRSVHEFGTEP